MAEKMKIIPLGGLNEIGKNMTVYEHGGEIIVVDCGMGFDKSGGKPGAVYGHIHLPQDIGDGSDVVLMAVGDKESPDTGFVFDQVGHVGYYQVDAVHVPVREAHAAVYHNNFMSTIL